MIKLIFSDQPIYLSRGGNVITSDPNVMIPKYFFDDLSMMKYLRFLLAWWNPLKRVDQNS